MQILDDVVGLAQVAGEFFDGGYLLGVASFQLLDAPLERLGFFATFRLSTGFVC
ncbi:MAG: hypothetical protein JST59_01235 [Actinobacteria bacterium]|nr:hypothetical protein [Actinomycetota bacterium]